MRNASSGEEYEEIRSKLIEDPFVCSKKPGVSYDDPADITYKRTIPKTPPGFKRKMVMRKDFTKADCYYDFVNGKVKRMRASIDVSRFLDENPEYKKDLSVSDFSFTGPKVMAGTVPYDVANQD